MQIHKIAAAEKTPLRDIFTGKPKRSSRRVSTGGAPRRAVLPRKPPHQRGKRSVPDRKPHRTST